MVPMSKRRREDWIVERAKSLAATGQFLSVLDIERKLESEGYPEANRLLSPGWMREDLLTLGRIARRDSLA
jgi:hypothetical protein